jgi:signal transduction histidine kinase
MSSRQITDRKILRVLMGGFTLVILLLMAASFVAIVNVQSIRSNAGDLVREQALTTRLIDEILREQSALSAVFHRLSRSPESVDRERVLNQLEEAGAAIHKIVASASGAPDERLWRGLEDAVTHFSNEVRRVLSAKIDRSSSNQLVQRHEAVLAIVARLIAAGQHRAAAAQDLIDRHSRGLVRESFALLSACLVLAVLCAVLTVRTTTSLFRQMEWQAGELSRVSWHMLERQESAARRFSHELHDELGQSLTAVKANLVALDPPPGEAKARQEDCLRLVDETIGNVRELSQLLRPTILDDFGLEAGIRWLGEGFTRRTGIQVDFQSDFSGRLPDEIETHLFRIAQEALTNVARHSGASRVAIRLASEGGSIRLVIADDGKGLPPGPGAMNGGLGIIGMRARARSAGGEVNIASPASGGVAIDVRLPARVESHATENSSLAG